MYEKKIVLMFMTELHLFFLFIISYCTLRVCAFPGSNILLSYRVEYLFFFCLLREFVRFANESTYILLLLCLLFFSPTILYVSCYTHKLI